MKKLGFWLFLLATVTLSLLPTTYLGAPVFSIWDKAQHAIGFAVLTVLAVHAYPSQPPLRLGLALLILGAAIELAQAASGWRSGDWLDGVADAVGIAAVLMYFRIQSGIRSTPG